MNNNNLNNSRSTTAKVEKRVGEDTAGTISPISKPSTQAAPVSSSKTRSGKSYSRQDRGGQRKRHDQRGTPQHNDFEWYSRYKDLLDPSTQLNFSTPFGGKLQSLQNTVPGIMAIPYVYCTGVGTEAMPVYNGVDATSYDAKEFYHYWSNAPYNMAARTMFMYVRSGLGGSRPYQASDMSGMLFAAINIFATIAYLERTLLIAKRYSYKNRYLGRALMRANGFDLDDVIDNYMQYVAKLNLLIKRANVIKVPSGIATLDRWLWLNGNIFKDNDNDNEKQQYIIYRPEFIYKYNEVNGSLEPQVLQVPYGFINTDAGRTFADVLTQLDECITSLWNSETFQIMIGDIDKAYQHNVVSAQPFEADKDITFVMSMEMAIQLQNADFLGDTTLHQNGSTTNNMIKQMTADNWISALTLHQDQRDAQANEGCVFYGPAPDAGSEYGARPFGILFELNQNRTDWEATALQASWLSRNQHYINLYMDNPSAECVVYATRFKLCKYYLVHKSGQTPLDGWWTLGDATKEGSFWLNVINAGTEILIAPCIYTLDYKLPYDDPASVREYYGYPTYMFVGAAEPVGTMYRSDIIMAAYLSNFALAPKLFYAYSWGDAQSGFGYKSFLIGDVIVPGDLDATSLVMINLASIYSMWLVAGLTDGRGQVGFAKYMINK